MASVFDVAKYFLANGKDITNKKLQKLVYYAYAWHLVLANDYFDDSAIRLFNNNFEAWVHGAVDPDLYREYRKYGSSCIPKYTGDIYPFSADEINILEQVNEVYGDYNGNELESINHQEEPWKKARNGLSYFSSSHAPIKDEDIYNYYVQKVSA